jgi:hypothetical protein
VFPAIAFADEDAEQDSVVGDLHDVFKLKGDA